MIVSSIPLARNSSPASSLFSGSRISANDENPAASSSASGSSASSTPSEQLSLLDNRARQQFQPAQSNASEQNTSPESELVSAFQERFANLAGDKQAFHALMKEVYGKGYDQAKAENIRQQALEGDFSWLPEIELVDQASLADQSGGQGAGVGLGAYDTKNNRILLSREMLENDPEQALDTLTEEIGHALDTQLNDSDTVGDEGELFSARLSGKSLSADELSAIRNDNDSGTIVVDGEQIDVEYGWLSDIGDAVSGAVSAVGDAVSGAVSAVGNAASDLVRGAGDLLTDGIDSVNDRFVTPLLNNLGPVGRFVNRHLVQPGLGLFSTGVNIFTTTVETGIDIATEASVGFINTTSNLLQGDFSGAWNSFTSSARNVAREAIGGIIETGALALEGAVEVVDGTFGLSETRRLTTEEQAHLRSIYGDSLDYSSIRIHTGGIREFVGMDPHAVGNNIYLPEGSFEPGANLDLLAHEAAHVWQFQNNGSQYISDALISYVDDRDGAYDYTIALENLTPWDDLTPDQQAEFAKLIGMAQDRAGDGPITEEGINQAISDELSRAGDPAIPDLTPEQFAYMQDIQQRLLDGEA